MPIWTMGDQTNNAAEEGEFDEEIHSIRASLLSYGRDFLERNIDLNSGENKLNQRRATAVHGTHFVDVTDGPRPDPAS